PAGQSDLTCGAPSGRSALPAGHIRWSSRCGQYSEYTVGTGCKACPVLEIKKEGIKGVRLSSANKGAEHGFRYLPHYSICDRGRLVQSRAGREGQTPRW